MKGQTEKKLLILYTELAGYLVSCVNLLAQKGVEIHIVRYPVNKEAPFQFQFEQNIHLHEINDHRGKLEGLSKSIQPDAILCSGWVEAEYLAVCASHRPKIPTILLLDNQWLGTLRQRFASLIARFRILPKFSHAWVPGAPQKTFALKLGFSEKNIRTGFYCADLEQFNTIFQRSFESKKQEFPKSILYVGRYLPFKGVELLWKVFARLVDSEFPDWKLICLGTGDLWEQRMQHPKIEHVGFVQPENMHHYLEKSGIFILPSTREPWGVVVQEMAAAGLPLICSNAIGAASAFLENNRNGFRFEANDEQDLEHALRSIMQKDQQSLVEMGRKSHELAQKINQEQWVKTLLDLL